MLIVFKGSERPTSKLRRRGISGSVSVDQSTLHRLGQIHRPRRVRRESSRYATPRPVRTPVIGIRSYSLSSDLRAIFHDEIIAESGVHGALVVLEESFTGDTMASALGIPNSKTIIRRHLATELESLVGPARLVIRRTFISAVARIPDGVCSF